MKLKDTMLKVKAVPSAHVMPLGATNQGQLQFIGKIFNIETREFDIIEDGVTIPYHPEYIKHLKDHSLLAVDLQTAQKAGVPFIETTKEE
jgi:hypothetical protein